ncbi:hypothetical protein [uncultured Jatrophihabitans sp.]|uniref:hypothetical protein n=1 Tax=uncultured Jatrophihabitans sp. TaxID=1610747 RepID=UPI0035CC1387
MTSAREQAQALHERFQGQFAQISADGRLSQQGKVERMAPVYLEYRDALAKVSGDDAWRKQQRVKELTRTAFGVPSDPIQAMSYRDALSRAEGIDDPAVAKYKLASALETGDTLMAQAFAKVASDNGWSEPLRDYMAAVPSTGQALTQLGELQANLNDPQQRFMDVAHFSPSRPAELDRVSDPELQAIVAPDGPTAQEQAATDFSAWVQKSLSNPEPTEQVSA